MKTVLITGANGFIGKSLADALKGRAVRLVGTTRGGEELPPFDVIHRISLGESLSSALKDESPDVIVHTANHEGAGAYKVNVEGTRRWFEEAESADAKLQILLSSLSAKADAISDYGRAKYELERLFIERQQVSFRLGIVVGRGGMFNKIRNTIATSPIVPLLDSGSAYVYFLSLRFLCDVLVDCINTNGSGLRGKVWNLQQPTPTTLRQLMVTIRKHNHYRSVFIPLPSLPILWILTLLEKVPLTLPVNATNIRGLRQSRYERFHSDFPRFGKEEYALTELIRHT